jgi:hypothetical protein
MITDLPASSGPLPRDEEKLGGGKQSCPVVLSLQELNGVEDNPVEWKG